MINEGQTFPSNFYEEIDMSKISYFCFNPICQQSSSRLFEQESQHNAGCSKWIANLQVKSPPTNISSGKLIFQPFSRPIQTILQSQHLQQLAIGNLSMYMNKLKDQILMKIDTIQVQVNKQIKSYFEPLIQCGNKIKNLMNLVKNNCSNGSRAKLMMVQIIAHENFGKSIKRQDMVFIPSCQQIQHSIFQNISNIPEQIFRQTFTFIPDTSLPSSSKLSLTDYLLNPADDIPKKMFKISSLLKIPQKQIYEKTQRSMSTMTLKVKCSICNTGYATDRKKDSFKIWKSLCQHLLDEHIQEIGYSYRYGIDVCNSFTSLEQVLYKMKRYKYEALELICKSGRRLYHNHYSNRNRLTVEYLYRGQQPSLPFLSIAVNQTNESNTLTAIIAFYLQKTVTEHKNIYVYTNWHPEIIYLKKMIELLTLKNIVVMQTRKNDQSAIIYHQEVQSAGDYRSDQRDQEERKSVN